MSRRAPSLAGWLWNGERLVVDDTVDGYLVRGPVVSGQCRNLECNRRITVDLQGLSSMGWGKLPLAEVRDFFRCYRKPRCDVTWIETYPEGVPLQHFVHDGESLGLAVICDGCGHRKVFEAQSLIDKLVRSGLGDGNTGVRKLTKVIRGACACGKRKWRVDVVRPDPVAEKQRRDAAGR